MVRRIPFAFAGVALGALLTGCAGVPAVDTSPELGRVIEQGEEVRYSVRPGARIERARLVPPAESRFGAYVKAAPEGETGVVVSRIIFGGTADRVGLWIGDRLLRLGARDLDSVATFRQAVLASPPDARLSLEYRRSDRMQTADLVMKTRRRALATREFLPDVEGFRDDALAGFEVVTIPAALEQRLRGVASTATVVSDVRAGSPAYHAGIRPGDRLLELRRQPVSCAAEVRAMLADRRPGERIPFVVEQGGVRHEDRVRLATLPDLTYVDIPLLLRVNDRPEVSEVHVATVVFRSENTWLPTSRREGLRELELSMLLGLLHWRQGRAGREFRFLWVLPIAL
jgi:predicted metalloprotease with PDZ domain